MQESTATELVARAIGNDRAAWEALVTRYSRLVWHVIGGFSLDGERRADAHQATWLKLAENLESIREPEALGGWLATTARNECLRQIRARDREVPRLEIELEPSREPLETHLLQNERDVDLWRAFRALGDECQRLLRLLLAEPPFSYDEIAAILDMKRGSIGKLRRTCLDTLRADPRVMAMEEQS